jgi:hypothetical protein
MTLAAKLNQVVMVARCDSRNSYGEALYGPRRAVRARVEQIRKIVRNVRGEEAVSNNRVYCEEEIGLTDRVWLPNSPNGPESALVPLSVRFVGNFTGSKKLCTVDL